VPDADEDPDASPLSSCGSFKERYAASLSQRFAGERAAARACRAQPPAPRRLRTLQEPPNPYKTHAAEEVAECRDPHVWPGYDPYGTPPDGHAIALGIRQLQKEDAAALSLQRLWADYAIALRLRKRARQERASTTAPTPMVRDANGVPDGYQTALAARRANR
jgi:hypothetical protein